MAGVVVVVVIVVVTITTLHFSHANCCMLYRCVFNTVFLMDGRRKTT